MLKQCKVVMLPTNEKTNIINTNQGLLYNSNDYIGINQHLYIISDDEIKEGDWFYNIHSKIVGRAEFNFGKDELAKKIIATTNSSLWRPSHKYASDVILLPQPSQQFINKYIEEYNKGNVITDVLVEYENKFDGKEYVDELDAYGYDKIKSILKINHKDNNIIIKIAKDSWSREEVIEFGNKVKEYCKNGWKSDSLHRVFFEWDKWIEENL